MEGQGKAASAEESYGAYEGERAHLRYDVAYDVWRPVQRHPPPRLRPTATYHGAHLTGTGREFPSLAGATSRRKERCGHLF